MRKWLMAAGVLFMSLTLQATAFASSSSDGHGASGDRLSPAEGWDHLWNEVFWDITIIGTIFALVTAYLLIAYARKSPDQEGTPPTLTTGAIFGWAIIPVFIFMADDFYLALKGWNLWQVYRTLPEENAIEVKLDASMWNWHYTYENGVETDNILVVPAGTPVVMRMTSWDTIHSMYVVDHKVKEDSMPGRVTHMWFYPKEVGTSLITCAEYCGLNHSGMYGDLVVKSPADYNAWLKEELANL